MTAERTDRVSQAPKRVLIVDDHPVLRRGLTALIDSEPDLTACGEAASAAEALAAVRELRPDMVVVDLELGGRDGLDFVKELKTRDPRVPALVFSMHDESVYAERALRAGARGYVDKQQLDETVLVAIHRVLDGGTYMSGKLERRLAGRFLDGRKLAAGSPLEALSDRELEVFRWIGQGRGTREIAETLSLSVKTIESHREHIKNKLGIQTAAQLAQRAAQWVETGRQE